MPGDYKQDSARMMIVLLICLINIIVLKSAYISGGKGYWVLLITLPLLFIAIYNLRKNK